MDLIEALNPAGDLAMSYTLMKGVRFTLEKFASDEGTCLKCLKAVFSKPFIDKEKSKWTLLNVLTAISGKICGEAEAIEAVIKILNKHMNNLEICEYCFTGLLSMTQNNSKQKQPNK